MQNFIEKSNKKLCLSAKCEISSDKETVYGADGGGENL
jgi:hypothetical protein